MTAVNGLIRQATQLRKSDTYIDNLTAGTALESGSTSIESDLNALRSQVNRLLDASGTTGKWYEDVTTVNSKKRSVKQLNTDLNTIELAAASFATLDQLKERIALIEFSFAGATPTTPGANTNKLGFVHTTGGVYVAGQVVLDTGTALSVLSFDVVRHLTTTAVVTGTVSLNANGLYAYENGVWVSKGGGLSVGLLDLFTIGSTPTSQTPGTGVVTAANLNTLTAGSSSNADLLHTHVIPAGVSAGDGILDTASVLSIRLSSPSGLALSGTSPNKTLEVTGVPALFTIGGSAVGATVNKTNLDTLTTGPTTDADSLHTHNILKSPMDTLGDIIYGGTLGALTKLPIGAAGKYLRSDASTPSWQPITEADLSLSANATNNVSTAKHGFAPILPNSASQYLNGQGNWTTPAGAVSSYSTQAFNAQTSVTMTHGFGAYPVVQILGPSNEVLIPKSIVNNTTSDFTVTFQIATTGTIIASVGSPQAQSVVVVTDNYIVLTTDRIVQCSTAGKTVTFPVASSNTGKEFIVDNSSLDDIYAVVSGGGTIERETTQTIPSDCALRVYSDGTAYRIY
jgi:hypothetical protein